MDYHYTTAELCRILAGQSYHIPQNRCFSDFAIDSRKIQPGGLFFSIVGENTDGHLYIEQACKNGAQGIIACRDKLPPGGLSLEIPLILVADPNRSLRDLAKDYRSRLASGFVLAITGSNGKTSSKEIAADLCRFLHPKVNATQGNYNNFIGVPITILSASLDASWWIVEMGTNHFGEIQTLSEMVRPNLGMITNVGESHLEFLENMEGVACEKSGIFAGMDSGTIVAIPSDLRHSDIVSEQAIQHGIRLVRYGFTSWKSEISPDYSATLRECSSEQACFEFLDQLFEVSTGNSLLLRNLLGVLTLLYLHNEPPDLLCEACRFLNFEVKGRMQFRQMPSYLLVDDTYNANPTSFNEVIQSLRSLYPQKRLLVVAGAMAELGKQSADLHFQLGASMPMLGVKYLFTFGNNDATYYIEGWKTRNKESENTFHTIDLNKLVSTFNQVVKKDDIVLVKGSRSAHMEQFVDAVMSYE
ncbi:MAG: UDP-N-acetylmuramoyl-tripeptide--D-alanyl-D-alanine ligase [SAR324 cluster bacterium]|nr:UDP-N-acetylmuramoyl-tripeptide--D-alanyl-D-alanine ligase [SAR324 cluster bacterium]